MLAPEAISDYDPEMRHHERSVLEYMFSEDFLKFPDMQYVGPLFRIFTNTIFFGRSIRHAALRNAMLYFFHESCPEMTMTTRISKWQDYDPFEHADRALKALDHGLANPSELDEGFLFAAWLLAIMATRCDGLRPFLTHMHGFFIIMKELEHKNSYLKTFWPMARDELFFSICLDFKSSERVMYRLFCSERGLLTPTTALQRSEYDLALNIVGSDRHLFGGVFYPSLWHHSIALRKFLRYVVLEEQHGRFERSAVLQTVLTEARRALQPLDTEEALRTINEHRDSLLGYVNANSSEDKDCSNLIYTKIHLDIFAAAIILHEACELLITVLEAESVANGFNTISATHQAATMLLHLQVMMHTEVTGSNPERRRHWDFAHSVILNSTFLSVSWIAGLGCPDHLYGDCKSLHHNSHDL